MKRLPNYESQEALKRRLALKRDCGLCRACCTTQKVENFPILPRPLTAKEAEDLEIDGAGSGKITRTKPADTPCVFLSKDPNAKGCTIYKDRPDVCRVWMCVWRSGTDALQGEERPDRLGIVFDTVPAGNLPFSYLAAVAAEPEDAAGCFARGHNVVRRLAAKGHLVVCESPSGHQEIYGPVEKVKVYAERMKKT